jgi:hypothetical protein
VFCEDFRALASVELCSPIPRQPNHNDGPQRNATSSQPAFIRWLIFSRDGDCLAAKLRPGNVHGAEGWEELLLPEIERLQKLGKKVVFRADAAFAKPEINEALESRGVKYAIRIPANENLEREVAKMVPVTSSSTLRAVPEAPSHGVVPAVPPPNSPAGVCWCACGISQKHYP